MHRRRFIAGLAASCLGLPSALAAPDAPAARERLTLLLPVPEGGSLALLGHSLAECLGDANVASLLTAKWPSAPLAITRFIDEYSLRSDALLLGGSGLVGSTIVAQQATSLADLAPVARLTTEYAACAVGMDSPFATLGDLLAALRQSRERISFCGSSRGSADYILAAMIARYAGVPARHLRYRSYVGGVGAIEAVVRGEQDCICASLGEVRNHLVAGRLRLLGLSAPQRLPGVPVATFVEQGLNIELSNWRGVFAPPGIGAETLDRHIRLMNETVDGAAWKATLFRYNWTGDYLAGPAFGEFVHRDTLRMRDQLTQLGL